MRKTEESREHCEYLLFVKVGGGGKVEKSYFPNAETFVNKMHHKTIEK